MKTIKKLIKVIKEPSLLKFYLKNKRGFSFDVIKDEKSGIARKVYKNYNQYLEHQKFKLEKIKNMWLAEQDKKYKAALDERMSKQTTVKPGMSVLCLGARTGVEVEAFIGFGCFAVGIDLNPGKENKYVVHGDFHNLQFANKSIDVVYTNSLDHAFDLDKLFIETKRVLKPGGIFVLEISETRESETASLKTNFEAIAWGSVDVIYKKITDYGFRVVEKIPFNDPWKGAHFSSRLNEAL